MSPSRLAQGLSKTGPYSSLTGQGALSLSAGASESYFLPLNIPFCICNTGTLKALCHNQTALTQAVPTSKFVICVLRWLQEPRDSEATAIPGTP